MTSLSGNKSFRSGNKKLFYNVIRFCDQEEQKELFFNNSTKELSQIAEFLIILLKRYAEKLLFKRVKKDVFKKRLQMNLIAVLLDKVYI